MLVPGDTSQDICEKLIDQYPELLAVKTEARNGDKTRAISQIKAEICEKTNRLEGRLFIIDRTERPYRYSLIVDDSPGDIDDDIIIDENLTESEIDIGYIYILDTNLYTKDGRSIYKIGKANDLDKRIKQLDSEQGCYQKHTLLHSYHVERPYKIEHSIHCVLDKGRVNPKKEGFYSNCVESNINLIKSMIELFKID